LTVRQAYEDGFINRQPSLAYTTVMTVMSHLAEKGLFTRRHVGKTHYYTVALSKEEFLARSAARQVAQLVANFGDLALARFAEQLAGVDPERLKRIYVTIQREEERGD